jgi:glucosamine--fructose-6-phosphate aminotransferase (isomerizing)
MCGIIGIASEKLSDRKLAELTVEILRRLEYRGYDSVGMASMSEDRIEVRKAKGSVEEFVKKRSPSTMKGKVFLGHTRWATHGEPSDINAHPHTDCSGEIAVVHNGTILNFAELKNDLIQKGHEFKSETDTEVVAHLIEHYRKLGMDNFTAFKRAILSIEGDHAILVVIKGDPRIFFSKRNNPLKIGVADGMTLISSDSWSMFMVTNKIIPINDEEFGYISARERYIEKFSGERVDTNSRLYIEDTESLVSSHEGYESFMHKEILESHLAVRETLRSMMRETEIVSKAIKSLSEARRIFVVGAGTSYHAGLMFALRLQKAGLTSIPVIASEHHYFRATEDDAVLVISQSGETMDSLIASKHYRANGARILSLTNTLGNSISHESDIALHTRAGPEVGVAATKTFTSQVAALLFLSSNLLGEDVEYLKEAEQTVTNSLQAMGYALEIGTQLCKKSNAYYLGRGLGVPMALEGALKIKEIAYIHAEAYPAGESKHGPIALVEKGFPVVFINLGEFVGELSNNIKEMSARGAETIVLSINNRLSDNKELKVWREVSVSVSDTRLAPLAMAPLIQAIAYYAAKCKGVNPDRPRNLAKTVTVQ